MIPPELADGELIPLEALARCLKHCGRDVRAYRGCRLVPPGLISIGDCSQIDEDVRVHAGEAVVIGRHVHLAVGCSITGGGRCEIGDYAGIGAGVRLITGTEVVDGSGLTNPTLPASVRVVRRGVVRIEAHAVVFTNAVILPDVVVGEGAVVAAGAVVHHDLKPWGIYAGNPLVQVGVRPSDRIRELVREMEEGGRR